MKKKSELDNKQKKFIKKKVVELGSIEEVKRLYDKDCLVDKFANKIAKLTFDKGA